VKVNYIIVQAGGKGTRLEHLTVNKPKALVPVDNLPVLFYLFRKFPDKRFIIIADYKREVMREYLAAFADVCYHVVDAEGKGTCGGIAQAAELLPERTPFLLIWSDLILPGSFEIPEATDNYIGLSQTFNCRWRYENNVFNEEVSHEYGVAGLFLFKDKSYINDVPYSGEFVRYLKDKNVRFTPIGLAGTREFGILEEYNKLGVIKTRPFNKLSIEDNLVIKTPSDKQGANLALLERNWYKYAIANGVRAIPSIHNIEPLTMERIDGKNIYECTDFTYQEKRELLIKIVNGLKGIHSIESAPVDIFSVKNAYYGKTIERLNKIRDLIPHADKKVININSRECRNIYFYRREFEKLLETIKCDRFAFIHGDCTFSNTMIRNNGEPVFIDPRGYFGYTKLFGDPNYDWAKLYYSVMGNYDRFNLKDFRLNIAEHSVKLRISSNGWEPLADELLTLSGADKITIKLLHAVIWLSLTTYAWQDYDSVCAAFYNGIYYLEECWNL
jgi:GTP:adenosylcobinamide-phosphate guanylyltransferase/thiamine kinase-like enzyme